jgi:AraC-like DNA-binding protein/mannose-6-phosphate isomerase-like protein (cupin superfamily)
MILFCFIGRLEGQQHARIIYSDIRMKPAGEKILLDANSSFTVRHFRPSGGFAFRWHQHAEAELTLIKRGRGTRFVGDTIEPFGPGDLVLLGAGLPHTWQSTPARRGPHETIVVQFLPNLFFDKPETRHIGRLLTSALRGLHYSGKSRDVVANMLCELPKCDALARLTGLLHILDRLSQDRSVRTLCTPAYQVGATAANTRRIDAVCAYLASSFLESITLEDAADRAHLSPAAFSRFFVKSTGRTLTEYLNELRIGHACRLLIETDQTVSQIAYASGFHNLSHFNRRFRRSRRTTPQKYRLAFNAPTAHTNGGMT